MAAIGGSHARLLLVMRLWALSTSMLQRAHRAVASSYIGLHRQDSSDSSSTRRSTAASRRRSAPSTTCSNRSYTQLIATPGLVDVDDEQVDDAPAMDSPPWTDVFWWRLSR